MLSRAACRRLLAPDDDPFSDAQLVASRDELSNLAIAIVDAFEDDRRNRNQASPAVPHDKRGDVEDRAGLHHVDVGSSAGVAPRRSFSDSLKQRRKRR